MTVQDPDFTHRRVLITGGLGFVGSSVAHRVTQLGGSVTILDSLEPDCGGNPANLAGIKGDVRLLRADVRDRKVIEEALRDADVVVHAAACTSHAGSMREPLRYLDVNVAGTIGVLEALCALGSNAVFVNIGTTSQIGRMLQDPVDERHPDQPLDAYSASKSAAEKYALLYARARGVRAMSLRLGNLYGPRAMVRSPHLGFVNYFIGLGLQDADITVYGEGQQRRALTYIDDVVDAIVRAIGTPALVGEHAFVASEQAIPVRDIAEAIARRVGGRVRLVPWPSESAKIEVGDFAVSTAKFREATGWAPRTDLDTGLARSAAYYRAHLREYLP